MTASVLAPKSRWICILGWLGAATILVACGSDDGAPSGAAGVGGASSAQGGGAIGVSGSAAIGGSTTPATGGIANNLGGTSTMGELGGVGGVTAGGSSAGGAATGGANSLGGATTTGGAPTGGRSTGGATTSGGQSPTTGGKAATGGVSSAGGAGATTGGNNALGGAAGSLGTDHPTSLTAIGANGTTGIDWPLVAGATAYRIYWSTTAGVTPQNGTRLEVADPGEVHTGVTNGTTYYYVVTAMSGSTESTPSPEASATPGGEWVLRSLGHGQFTDLASGNPVAKMPIADRNHVLLFPEGYLATDLARFDTDVKNWMTGLFALDPYSQYKESFIVWSLPRASNTRTGGTDTAFRVPVSGAGVGDVSTSTELRTRIWEAVTAHPVAPTRFGSGLGGMGTAQKATAAVLILDESRNPPQAGISGMTTTLANPSASTQRLATAFGIGHEHEFSHAFARLVDEYMEEDLAGRTWPADGQSNVVNTSVCGSMPWAHLVYEAGINTTDQLIGAFGRSHIGFHSELLCQMNGSHDNATYYGTSNLRSTRFCNFCRELVAYRVLSRVGLVASFSEWTNTHRASFYQRYSMSIPTTVPQRTSAGTTYFEACTQAYQSLPRFDGFTFTPSGPVRIGDVVLAPEDLIALGWLL